MNQPKHAVPPDAGGASRQPEPGQAPEIWDQTLDELRCQMTAHVFNTHLSGSQPRDWQPQDNAWVIEVRNHHSPHWLRRQLGRVVRQALARHTPGLPEPSLVYFAAAPGAAPPRTAATPQEDAPAEAGTGKPDGASASRQSGARATNGAPARQDQGQPPAAQTAKPRPPSEPAQAPRQKAGRQATAAWKGRLQPTDIYIKVKTAFRDRALCRLKGAKLSVFMSLALHMDADGTSAPGIKRIMQETGHARGTVCRALDELASPPLSLIEKVPTSQTKRPRGCIRMPDCYRIRGYAWWGAKPAPALYEEDAM